MDAQLLRVALEKARALLSSETRWIANEFAADLDGAFKPVGSPDAVRFSLWGAIVRVGASKERLVEARELFESIDPASVANVRAGKLTYVETLALLDAAIALLAAPKAEAPKPRPDAPKPWTGPDRRAPQSTRS